MVQNIKNRDLQKKRLDTWKEIADYMGRDIRTCQRWEMEFDLPVYRMSQHKKSRVFCYTNELDDWIENKSQKAENHQEIRRFHPSKRKKLFMLLFSSLAVFTGFLIFLASKINVSTGNNPLDFKLYGSKLVILGNGDKKLWEFDTGINNLENENHYRTHSMEKQVVGIGYYLPRLIIKDLDSDGQNEVLLSYCTKDNSLEDMLICFSSTGEQLWNKSLGRVSQFGDILLSDDYRIKGFDIKDFDSDGKYEIMVLINHQQSFPGRALFFDAQGNELGEFWNSGHLYDYDFYDLDNDRTDEIIIAGYNEEWKKHCLVILDPFEFDSASPQSLDQFIYRGPRQDECKGYILLPAPELSSQLTIPDFRHRLIIDQNPENRITYECLIIYRLDFNLELKEIDYSERFIAEYLAWKENGLIDRSFSQFKQDLFDQGLKYRGVTDWHRTLPENFFKQFLP